MKLPKQQETKSTILFSAKLFRPKANEKTGSWTLTLPKKASAKLPSRGMTMVEGTINGFPFEPLSNQTAKEVTGSRLTKPCAMPQAQML
jgi:hypothetical protein